MSIWPQTRKGCVASIQRTIVQSFSTRLSQTVSTYSSRSSSSSFIRESLRLYSSDERDNAERKGNVRHLPTATSSTEQFSQNLSKQSNSVHQDTSRQQSTKFFSPLSDKIKYEEATKSILMHCDRAIILSRDSSDNDTFLTAKEHLYQATRIYVDLVKRSSLTSDVDVLSYETYLIRSGYAHVIRSIGALVGRDGMMFCGRMLHDYLRFELDLLQMNFESADGGLEWRSKRSKKRKDEENIYRKFVNSDKKEEIRLEEALLLSGPFLQDFAPILYDAINDLTSEQDGNHFQRKFTSQEFESLARDLRLLLRQFPRKVWTNPSSLEWDRFRTPTLDSFRNASSVIDSSIRMIAKAYANEKRTSNAMDVLVDEMIYWNSPKRHIHRLHYTVSKSFRRQVRHASKFLLDQIEQAEASVIHEKVQELLDTFQHISSMLLESGGKNSLIPLSIWDTQDYTEILHSSFILMRFMEGQLSLQLFLPEQEEQIRQISYNFRSWLERCINTGCQEHQIHLPQKLSIAGLNLILSNFMMPSILFGNASVESASRLVDYMLASDGAAKPNDITLTILIGNSAKLQDAKTLRSAILVAHLTLRKKFRKKFDADREFRFSRMGSLLQKAVFDNDSARMVALLNAAKFAKSHSRQASARSDNHCIHDQDNVSLDVAYISAQKAIMILYPSLQINRARFSIRRVRKRKVNAMKRRAKKLRSKNRLQNVHSTGSAILNDGERLIVDQTEKQNQAQFHPSVLIAALHLTAKSGKTGLAERIWRLWIRVAKRQSYEEEGASGYGVIRALTILNQLSSLEVQRQKITDARLIRYRRTTNLFHSLLGPRNYTAQERRRNISRLQCRRSVRGWAHDLELDKNVDHRIAKRDDRIRTARKITRLRYLQLRDLWFTYSDTTSQYNNVKVGGVFENSTPSAASQKISQVPVSQIDSSCLPDHRFYRSLLSVFRQNVEEDSSFEKITIEGDESFLDFFKLIVFDMESFGLKVPADLYALIQRDD